MPQHHDLFIISIITKLIIITFNLLILAKNVTSTIDLHYVHHHCSRSGSNNSYDSGSEFEANLNTTLLSPNNASLTGFSKLKTGEGNNRLYSVLYCQGDIKGQDCHDCSEAAGRNILQKCHLLKEAIIWYEECTLQYSDNRNVVFSTEEVSGSPSHRSYNFSSVLKNLDDEKQTFEELMDGLIVEAANDDDDKRYATGEAPLTSLSENMTLKGAVQCRPDLVSVACETCLRSAIKQMDGWSTTMVLLPSCNLKFGLVRGPPSSSSSGGSGGSSLFSKIFRIIFYTLFGIAILWIIYVFYRIVRG